ncbi:MAG TPA: SMC-Scp complex subunit ScpB [Solirubrobacteraceae bacterium]
MSVVTAELERTVEALLFLSPDPVAAPALADATGAELHEVVRALESLREHYEFERRGLVVRQLAGGFTLSTHPETEAAARRLLSRPRTPPLTPAQAETLAIVAYLQPVSRPEIARIRGVSAESAATTLLERGLIEESGRSQFGAVLYRTTDLFLKLFGLDRLDELPAIEGFDPPPELESELRDRLLRAGEARAGGPGAAAASTDGVSAVNGNGTAPHPPAEADRSSAEHPA